MFEMLKLKHCWKKGIDLKKKKKIQTNIQIKKKNNLLRFTIIEYKRIYE
jgi:hypothetical protein